MTLFLERIVSIEIFQKFKIYESLLKEWNNSIPLVQQETLIDFDHRHVIDSLQLIPIIQTLHNSNASLSDDVIDRNSLTVSGNSMDESAHVKMMLNNALNVDIPLSIIDVGTGAGFPGMVLAISGFQNVTLCDSNHKKCLFLSEVARYTDTNVTIINDRVENLKDKYDLIVSRACTDLTSLCSIMRFLASSELAKGLFHKGRNWQTELKAAQINWNFSTTAYRSITSDDGIIMVIEYLKAARSTSFLGE